MLASYFILALSWAIGLNFVSAELAPLNSDLEIRNAPGTSSMHTLLALRRALSASALKRDTVFKNSTSLDKSWDGAVLFSECVSNRCFKCPNSNEELVSNLLQHGDGETG